MERPDPIEQITLTPFDYPLPEHRIAKHPLGQRDASKLLIYREGQISQRVFSALPEAIAPGSLIVFNNTRVIQARLQFRRRTGAPVEIFLLDPHEPSDYQMAFEATQGVAWHCLVGNLRRWKGEPLVRPVEGAVALRAQLVRRTREGAIVRFDWDRSDYTFAQLVERSGEVPLPPYLNRPPEPGDRERYQTVYAKPEGSVAAPTAGLHFTPEVIERLRRQGVGTDEVTLHVGAGTFKPVKSDRMADHDMHAERFAVTRETLEHLMQHRGATVAVGTTSMRTLESIYWLGVRMISGRIDTKNLTVEQWDGYRLPQAVERADALAALARWLDGQRANALWATTSLLIAPGYPFKLVDALITNFHQPRSTLLLLVAAFVGEDWRRIYDYALRHDFRFLSYGDSSLLFRG